MNFSVEEENLICIYHTSDRRRTMARMLAALPDMDTEMQRLANGTITKLERMTDADWGTWYARAMAVFLNGGAIAEPDERGQRLVDDSFLVLINASPDDIEFTLPGADYAAAWSVELDTAPTERLEPGSTHEAGAVITVEARSMTFLSAPTCESGTLAAVPAPPRTDASPQTPTADRERPRTWCAYARS